MAQNQQTVLQASQSIPINANVPPNMVYQHGTIGRFINRLIEDPPSEFVRCIYQDRYNPEVVVVKLCEKRGDCCLHGCCPKDQFWMAGLFAFLCFVLLVFLIGACSMIICYQRNKYKQHKAEQEAYEAYAAATQVDGYPNGYAYSIEESVNY